MSMHSRRTQHVQTFDTVVTSCFFLNSSENYNRRSSKRMPSKPSRLVTHTHTHSQKPLLSRGVGCVRWSSWETWSHNGPSGRDVPNPSRVRQRRWKEACQSWHGTLGSQRWVCSDVGFTVPPLFCLIKISLQTDWDTCMHVGACRHTNTHTHEQLSAFESWIPNKSKCHILIYFVSGTITYK